MILILSPHLDDALFSMTNYLLHYNGFVIICTLFTKEFDKKSFNGDYKYYADTKTRKLEDNNAIQKLLKLNNNLKIKTIYLNLYDDLFRYYLKNINIEKEIIDSLRNINKYYNFGKIFCPLGIGNHPDHCLTYKCASKVFDSRLIYYFYDYPYCNLKVNIYQRLNQLKIKNNIKLSFNDYKKYYYHPIYQSTNCIIRLCRITNVFLQYLYHKLFNNDYLCDSILHTSYYNYQKKFQVVKLYETQIVPIFGSFNILYNTLQTKYKEYYIKIDNNKC